MRGSSPGNRVNARILGVTERRQREKKGTPALASIGHAPVTRARATLRTTVHGGWGLKNPSFRSLFVSHYLLSFLFHFAGTPMISALTVATKPEGRPEIAVLDGHERDGRIDGASVCIDGLDLGSCTDAPRSFQKLLRREGKELGLKTLADNFGILGLCYLSLV
ncbi:hypothetical protein CXB51_024337 [Gossypium anomalum]|uniref:Uncharacterized protein n=1 Tax=Gossypium anomalum TaxID=47600 RepID=A0A8J5YFX9_9ROSI|nr:hypothetical protein CXB51_024337 [Gossypium anomalum]